VSQTELAWSTVASPRRRREHDDPGSLPLPAGPVGNGKFVPAAPSRLDRDPTLFLAAGGSE